MILTTLCNWSGNARDMNVGHDVNLADTDTLGARMPASERARPTGTKRRGPSEEGPIGGFGGEPPKPKFRLDTGSLLYPALRRWPWLIFGALAGFAIGLALATSMWKMTFSSSTQLVRHDPPVANEAFRPRPVDVLTLIGRMEDPAFLRRVGQLVTPKLTSGEVLAHMRVVPQRNSGIMTITSTYGDAGVATNLANAFARETVKFTQELQSEEAAEAATYVMKDLAETESQLEEAQKAMPALTRGLPEERLGNTRLGAAGIASRNAEKIQEARDELMKLLVRFTDAHPQVKQQRATIAALEAEAATGVKPADANTTDAGADRYVTRDEFEIGLFRVRQLESLRMQLSYRLQQIELFKANPPGSFRITVPASGETLMVHRPWLKIALLATLFGVIGLTLTATQVLFREFFDGRLKTTDDVTRVTGLPVIAALGDLRKMTIAAREDWAFRTWIALQDRLSFSPHHGLICGITSSRAGDGRSTWVSLLAGAARKCGFRVLTIGTKPTADGSVNAQESAEAHAAASHGPGQPSEKPGDPASAAQVNGSATPPAAGAKKPEPGRPTTLVPRAAPEMDTLRGMSADSEFTAMTASALFTPAEVTEKLMGPESDPLVHIPLPGWAWNLERRKQWQGALNVWRKIENVVILVELPPASVPEAVLLASNLPNILWLVESGKSEAAETRSQLATLRHARCNLVGSVINRAMNTFTQGRLSRWMGCITLLACLGLSATTAVAQNAPAVARPGSFSMTSPEQRAEWQRRLTLGPGDVLSLSVYAEPELTVKEIPIGPDGRISYLEANDVMAAGLTVDELRTKLSQELGKFRREPQVIVSPVAYKSKKYYVLGKVSQRGVFTLDRPTTLLEAVAQARGMETGMSGERTMVELADLSRSFVARGGKKVPVDFQRLFEEGDLSQNIALEPDDYIYFPGAEQKEVYVLGEVTRPGPYAYTSQIGALGAVAARGGFTAKAWRTRLLVIRGSLERPETFVVDAASVLSANSADIRLQPRDIVYVSRRPWATAEELLDEAASAFVTSAIVVWTGLRVTQEIH